MLATSADCTCDRSSAIRATVLIPTFDHGPTLRYSVSSALAQTVSDIEVFVVGDGVPDITREIVAEFARTDERIRFFDNPKGPRRGEIHRHAALRSARGEIVCYLADDDVWLPWHVSSMLDLLRDADFAHACPATISPEGDISVFPGDLSVAPFRRSILSGINFIPLAHAAHTLDMYRRLPHGWRTTPPDIPTDLYMWQQFLSDPTCRAVSGTRATVLHFASSVREDMSPSARLEELERWARRMATEENPHWYELEVLRSLLPERAQLWARAEHLRWRLLRLRLLAIPGIGPLLRRVAQWRRRRRPRTT